MTGMKLSVYMDAAQKNSGWLFWLVALSCFVGCGRVTPLEIAGTYNRSKPGLKEVIVVKTNGTFEQTINFIGSDSYSVKGSWTNEYSRVTFDKLYITLDVETGRDIKPPELRYMVYLQYGDGVLVNSFTHHYLFDKNGVTH